MADAVSKRSVIYEILLDVEKGNVSAKNASKTIGDLDKSAKGLTSTFKETGAAMLAAFGAQQLIANVSQFGKEAFELGLKVEGVKKAFDKLNNPALLTDLRTATKGLVDDFTLMQSAVKADKFKIPLNELSDLLKFARIRAKETGQEVNELVKKIVDGIGKRNGQVLDDFGLRIQDIQKEFLKTGDFVTAAGNVIRREMQSAGDEVLSTAEKVEQARVSWENFKISVGIGMVDALEGTQSAFQDVIDVLGKYIPLFRASTREVIDHEKKLQEIYAASRKLVNQPSIFNQVLMQTTAMSLEEINRRLEELSTEFAQATDTAKQKELATQIIRFREMKKAIEDLLNPTKELNKAFDEGVGGGVSDERRKALLRGEKEVIKDVTDARHEALKERRDAEIQFSNEKFERTQEEIDKEKELDELRRQAVVDGFSEVSGLFTQFAALAEQGSKQQVVLSNIAIIANQAAALAAGIRSAATLPYPANIAAAISVVATITGLFASIKNMQKEAQNLQSQVPKVGFAEGTEYLERGKNPKGKDTIPIWANEGEAIIPTDKNAQYPGVARAMIEGNLEDLIAARWINPALAVKAVEHARDDSRVLDYSERFYRQLLEVKDTNNILRRIDRKLGKDQAREVLLRMKRKF